MDWGTWRKMTEAERAKIRSEPYPEMLKPYKGDRVEVVTTYGETRRFWVGVSTGWQPCYLEVKKANSDGGPGCEHTYRSVKLIKRGPRR